MTECGVTDDVMYTINHFVVVGVLEGLSYLNVCIRVELQVVSDFSVHLALFSRKGCNFTGLWKR